MSCSVLFTEKRQTNICIDYYNRSTYSETLITEEIKLQINLGCKQSYGNNNICTMYIPHIITSYSPEIILFCM